MKRAKIFVVTLSSFLCISGCAYIPLTPLSSYKIGKEPEIGQDKKVHVGEPIYSEFDYTEQEVVILPNGYVKHIGLGGSVELNIAPRTILLGYRDNEGLKQYCSIGPVWHDDIICFVDIDNDKHFDKLRGQALYLGKWIATGDTSPPYVMTTSSDIVGQRMELVYEGISSDGTLKFIYREYSNNLARPAFYQEVNYVLNKTGITNITFRGAEIEVLEANNNFISYRIKSNFRKSNSDENLK